MTTHQTQMSDEFYERLVAERQKNEERAERVAEEMLANLTGRERALIKEVAVMGYFLGQLDAGGVPREEYPKDSVVLNRALHCATSPTYSDLYPTLTALGED